jgi:putative flavoprotein involved in K+ transport
VRQTDTLVIGAGQAGLAISSCLSALGIDHVLIERGRVAERWCSQRWDSLRLLTPNWMTRLPGYAYSGPDPEGFMARDEVAAFLSKYGEHSRAPVFCHTRVERVSHTLGGYLVTTDRGNWIARSVVLATGACDHAAIPEMARNLPGDIRQISPSDYSRPDCLPAGGVLVVGASATGIQLADEISRSGRDVTLAAGRHVRMPRRYRGRDIMDWMDASGFLNQTADSVRDLASARRQPSLQLAGGRGNAALDLHALQSRGVRITGRAAGADGTRMFFEPDLATQCAASEARRQKVLAMIDTHIARARLAAPEDREAWKTPDINTRPTGSLDLKANGIRSIIWATGFRRDYSWLNVPVLDAAGELVHDNGITPGDGLFAIGLPFLRRRNSTFIDGAGSDAFEISNAIAAQLGQTASRAA